MVFLVALVVLHALVIIGNTAAFFILPFTVSWYIALPLNSFIMWVTFSPGHSCPLTRLENKLRKKLGLRIISGFIKHYFMGDWKTPV
jgi:hypothetical protein